MKVIEAEIPGVKLIEPQVFGDQRGFFLESYNRDRYRDFGISTEFIQDNLSYSQHGVLRGLHFQHPMAQGKLVTVLMGEVYDVLVDIRKGSPDYGRWLGFYLSGENKRQLFIPQGFAHGFLVTTESALFSYKCDMPYAPQNERSIAWDDPDLAIDWPISSPKLSAKDMNASYLRDLDEGMLPSYEGPIG